MLLHSILKTSLSMDSSTSAALILVEYNRIDGSNGDSGNGKSVKRFERPLVWKNVYWNTNLPSIINIKSLSKIREKRLLLCWYNRLYSLTKSINQFCQISLAQELFWYQFSIVYWQKLMEVLNTSFFCFKPKPFAPSSYMRNAHLFPAISVLEILFERRRASPEIRAEIFDGWKNIGEILHYQKLVARKCYKAYSHYWYLPIARKATVTI